MKFSQRRGMPAAEGDMTPMIDMTFQLIAFFMVLINFTESQLNERIRLPSSVLAKPPDEVQESPLVLQLTDVGTVLLSGDELPVGPQLETALRREAQVIRRKGKSVQSATVIIRADLRAKTGIVQQLIKACQDAEFESFALRAKQAIPGQEPEERKS